MSRVLELRDVVVRRALAGRGGWWPGRGARSGVEIVRGVSLTLDRGSTLAVVGESGSGKTTLALALLGLVPLGRGEVEIGGRSVPKGPDGRLRPDRSRVAMMFQDPVGSLSPRKTVRFALEEPFRIHRRGGDPASQVPRLLDLVGLGEDFADRYPHQLSGGQARRVAVARALALDPALVIADEPTAGLDVSIQGDVLNLLADLRERLGLALMVITHDLNVVRHVADTMAIMYLGRFVEQGPAEEIFRRPRHPYTEALLAANPRPDPDAALERIELAGEVPSPLEVPSGCEFHPRCPIARADCRVEPVRGRPIGETEGHRVACHHPL